MQLPAICLALLSLSNACSLFGQDTHIDLDAFTSHWRELEKSVSSNFQSKLKFKPLSESRIQYLYSSLFFTKKTSPKNLAAVFDRDGIHLNERLSKQHQSQILLHEISHLFLEEYCPGAFTDDYIFHEGFAQILSKDYLRIAYDSSQFAYSKAAISWLKSWQKSPYEFATASRAIARLIVSKGKSIDTLTNSYFKSFFDCKSVEFTSKTRSKDLLNILLEDNTSATIPDQNVNKRTKAGSEFLLLDAMSLEPLFSAGNHENAYPPGSILKPLLIATIPELRIDTISGSSPYWECAGEVNIPGKKWTWKEALAHSCNGFFLEHHRKNRFKFDAWIDLLNKFQIKHSLSKMDLDNSTKVLQVSTGLLPGILVTPPQVAGLYRWLYDDAPEVAEALKKTVISGTLRGTEVSDWFKNSQFALKTGTVRNSLNDPLEAWVVGLGPLGSSSNSTLDTLFVAHAHGKSPADLLPWIQSQIKKYVGVLGPQVQVQILPHLFREASFKFTCRNSLFRISENSDLFGQGSSKPQKPLFISMNEFMSKPQPGLYTCYEGPMQISYTHNKAHEVSYYGRLRVTSFDHAAQMPLNLPISTRRAKVKAGSQLLLETSRHHYIRNVLANEYANGYEATLKALSLAVAMNSTKSRHGDRPICDSSHCQIFSEYGKIRSIMKSQRLADIGLWAQSILNSTIFQFDRTQVPSKNSCRDLEWFPFSLGGQKPWTETRSIREITRALNLTQTSELRIHIDSDQKAPNPTSFIVINSPFAHLKIRCEDFRNQLKLPSCPKDIVRPELRDTYTFAGIGEGHGLGMDLTQADVFASQGASADALFKKYFPGAPPFCAPSSAHALQKPLKDYD